MPRLLVVFLAATNIFATLYAPQPILPMLAEAFSISVPTVSLSISLPIIALAIASLILAPLFDRWERKKGILIFSVLLLIPSIFLCFSSTFAEILLWRTWQGVAVPGVTSLLMAYALEEFPVAERGRVLGIYVSATVAGGLSGRIIGGLLADWLSWQAPFFVFALWTVMVTVMIWKFLPPSLHQSERSPGGGFLIHLQNPALVGTFLVGFSQFFTFLAIFTYIPFYASQPPFSLRVGQISLLFLTFLCGVFSAPAAGYLSDRIGRRYTMAIGHSIAMIAIFLTFVPSLYTLVFSLCLLALGNFASQSAATAYVGDVATQSRGAATALYQFFYYVGGSLGAWLPGLLWHKYHWGGVAGITIFTILLALASNLLLAGRTSWSNLTGETRIHSQH